MPATIDFTPDAPAQPRVDFTPDRAPVDFKPDAPSGVSFTPDPPSAPKVDFKPDASPTSTVLPQTSPASLPPTMRQSAGLDTQTAASGQPPAMYNPSPAAPTSDPFNKPILGTLKDWGNAAVQAGHQVGSTLAQVDEHVVRDIHGADQFLPVPKDPELDQIRDRQADNLRAAQIQQNQAAQQAGEKIGGVIPKFVGEQAVPLGVPLAASALEGGAPLAFGTQGALGYEQHARTALEAQGQTPQQSYESAGPGEAVAGAAGAAVGMIPGAKGVKGLAQAAGSMSGLDAVNQVAELLATGKPIKDFSVKQNLGAAAFGTILHGGFSALHMMFGGKPPADAVDQLSRARTPEEVQSAVESARQPTGATNDTGTVEQSGRPLEQRGQGTSGNLPQRGLAQAPDQNPSPAITPEVVADNGTVALPQGTSTGPSASPDLKAEAIPPDIKPVESPAPQSPVPQSAPTSIPPQPGNVAERASGEGEKTPEASVQAEQQATDAPQVNRKPVYEMSPDELDSQIKIERDYDKNTIKRLFGDRADEYNKAFRKANSTYAPPEETNAASRKVGDLEDSLTAAQRNELFGINQPERPSIDHLRNIKNSINGLDFDSPQELGRSLRYAITDIGQESDPEKMNERQQTAYATLRYANEQMHESGMNEAQVMEAAIKASASRFSDPEDASFMLRRWLGEGSPKSGSDEVSPPSQMAIASPGENKAITYQRPEKAAPKEVPPATEPPAARTNKTTLLASSPTKERLLNSIARYYGGSEKTLEKNPDGTYRVVGKNGVLNQVRVIEKGGRFRFESVNSKPGSPNSSLVSAPAEAPPAEPPKAVEGGTGELAKAVGFDQAEGDTKQGDIFGGLKDQLTAAAQHTADSAKRMAGNLFPSITRRARTSGEAMSRWIAARAYAKEAAPVAARQILGEEGANDPKMDTIVGTLLAQDNLDSIRNGFVKQSREAETPEDRKEALANAARVKDIVGAEGSPIKTQTQYEKLLKDPKVQAVVDRYKQWFSNEPDRNFRIAQGIAPDEEMPSRGEATGARVNLKAVLPDDPKSKTTVYTARRGNLNNPLTKKSPFARQAFGSGQAYDVSLSSMIGNTLAKGTEVARQHEAYDQLVKDGVAVYGKPGTSPEIDGKPTVPFDIKKKTVVTPDGKTVPLNKQIYVRSDVAGEFRKALAVDAPVRSAMITRISALANKTALASSIEATYHLRNQLVTAIKSPGIGLVVPDLVANSWKLAKGDPETQSRLMEIARIGALREKSEPLTGANKFNPLAIGSKVVEASDRVGRLMMDKAFTKLAQKGIYKDTETNRRDFINQLGQYNIRGQHTLVALSRDLGTGPFVTAGTNFYAMGAKSLALDPGAKATSFGAAVNLRARVLARYASIAGAVAITNYLQTGRVDGGKNIPFGSIVLGHKKDGSVRYFDALGTLTPLLRGARELGLKAAANYARGKTTGRQAIDDGVRDVAGAAVQPFAGPLVNDLSIGLTGYSPTGYKEADTAKEMGRTPQIAENLKAAAKNANPLIGQLTSKSDTSSRGPLGPFGFGAAKPDPFAEERLAEKKAHEAGKPFHHTLAYNAAQADKRKAAK